LYFKGEPGDGLRGSPLEEIFLTNADLDHALGLLLLREGEPLQVTAPEGVRETLGGFLRFDKILKSGCGIEWKAPGQGWNPCRLAGLEFQAVPFPKSAPPRFAGGIGGDHGTGYLFRQQNQSPVVGFFPDVQEIDDALFSALESCSVIFFDGTFWLETELQSPGFGERTAREMGHIPVSESMQRLSPLIERGIEIFYLHINNTNPILDPQSEERRILESAGFRLAEDGMRLFK
jgi:pyrroloquinoline quinone biosynthesis protein B